MVEGKGEEAGERGHSCQRMAAAGGGNASSDNDWESSSGAVVAWTVDGTRHRTPRGVEENEE